MIFDNMSTIPTAHNIGDNVYYMLQQNIVNLKLKPGELLNVTSISELLNVSRTPVRDALIKLGKDGLVDVIPQKGTRVSRIDIRRVEEELFLRQSLEVRAVTVFMQKYKESHINRLMEYINKQDEALLTQDYVSCLQHDDAFHHVFFEAIDKNLCWETIESMSGHYRRVRLMSIWDRNIFQGVIEQHRQMVKNITSNNIQMVRKLFLEHSSKLVKEIGILSEKYPNYFKDNKKDNFLLKDYSWK
ncbi:MAG TPA: GntR family transcriptional regulator [Thermoclostridium sp.]|nr:GntR family transcriptional regulator [Thermoclostridium sp.]